MTNHFQDRIAARLAGVVTEVDIKKALAGAQRFEKEEKIYLGLRRLGKSITIHEEGYKGGNGSGINGDCLVAVIKQGALVTILLAKEKNGWYFRQDSRRGLVFI